MFAHDLHVALAVAAVVVAIVAVLEATIRTISGHSPGRVGRGIGAVVEVVVGMTAAAGLAMFVRGERPNELLHVVYAGVAFVTIPVADSFTASSDARRRAGARLIGALIALGVIIRLFATG